MSNILFTTLQEDYAALRERVTALETENAAQARRIAELEFALKEAGDNMQGWGAYASGYLQEKWDLAGDLAKIDAALAAK